MTPSDLVCCCGSFPCIPFFDLADSTLSCKFRIPTGRPAGSRNRQIAQVRYSEDPRRRVIAVSSSRRPFPVLVFNVQTRCHLFTLHGSAAQARGLECIPSTRVGPPLILVGAYADSEVLVFEGNTGQKRFRLRESPPDVLRILHVPQWDFDEVFVSGYQSVVRLRVEQGANWISRYDGHGSGVSGLGVYASRGLICTCSWDRTARLWPRDQSAVIAPLQLSGYGSCCLCFEEKSALLVGLTSGGIEHWDVRSLKSAVMKWSPAVMGVEDIIPIDDGVFCSGGNSQMVLWKLATGDVVKRWMVPGYVTAVRSFSEDRETIHTASTCAQNERFTFLVQNLALQNVWSLFVGVVNCRILLMRWFLS